MGVEGWDEGWARGVGWEVGRRESEQNQVLGIKRWVVV